jgi:hypothetical protein
LLVAAFGRAGAQTPSPAPRPAQSLDTVRVLADRTQAERDRATLLGVVVDSLGAPVPEAEVQLAGANIQGTTRSNGGFYFSPLVAGTYAVRVRKLGYAPVTVVTELTKGDDRQIAIVLHPLAVGLDPVVVTEQSGYGDDQIVWDEFDRRQRWQSFKTRFLGPEDLKSYHQFPLDMALVKMGINEPAQPSSRIVPLHINPDGTSAPRPVEDLGTVCILIDGKTPVQWPLHTFTANELEMLEVYPSGTEETGTVKWYFPPGPCNPPELLQHPTYYVLWFKRKPAAPPLFH